jgi:hypothetical protein
MGKTTFKWGNYTKPTPRNLKMFMEFWKGAIVLITANSIDNEWPEWLSISILFGGYAVDRMAKFFAQAEEDEAKSKVTVEFPAAMGDHVTVTETTETKDESV